MIYIYRGDDTDWNNEQFVTINVTSGSSSIDLSTMSAVFTLGNFTQTYSLAEGSFKVSLSSEITRQFPYGPLMGSIKILDSQHRIKTATTDIPFYVTSEVITLQNQDLVIEVPGVSINVTVGGTVSYNDLLNKPSINGVTVEGSNAAEHYNLANKTDLDAHIANKNNPHEVNKAQVGLGNVDNTSDANKPISNATANALAGKVSKSGDTMTGNLTMSSGTSIVFPNSTIKENQAGNPIIGDGNGNGMVILADGHGAAFFTNGGSSYTEVVSQKDVKSTYSPTGTSPVNGTAVALAISTKQDNLTPAQLNAVNSGIDSTKVGQIETNRQNIANEVTNRQTADNGLQTQIDALSAASDVTDIVGTYAELQTYDTSKLKDNDIIKVLTDSTHNNASSYYRWSTHTETFTYIGSEGPYYTKSEADTEFLSKSDAATNYLTQANAASTYATQSSLASGLATKASSADGDTITDSGSAISTIAVKEQRASAAIKQWVGTKAQYEAITTKDANTIYVVTDETDVEAITVDSALSATSEHPVQNKVITNALQNIDALPSQTGQSGKFLTTDGSTASWATVSAGASLSKETFTGQTGTTIDLSSITGTVFNVYKNGILLNEGLGNIARATYTGGTSSQNIVLANSYDFKHQGTWKVQLRFIWHEASVVNPIILGTSDADRATPIVGCINGKQFLNCSFNGTSWDIYVQNTVAITENDVVLLTVGYNGKTYYIFTVNETQNTSQWTSTTEQQYTCQGQYPFMLFTQAFSPSDFVDKSTLIMPYFKIWTNDELKFDGANAVAGTDFTNNDCTVGSYMEPNLANYSISSSTLTFGTPLKLSDYIVLEVVN